MTELEAAGPSAGATMRIALVWNAANLAANQLAGAVIFFVLARALPPAVFGVLALALVFTEFFTQQGASAVRDALVQRRDFSPLSLSTMFWIASGCAVLATLAGFLGAPLAAAAFAAPALAHVLPALSLSILLAPPIAVMEARIMRDLHFRSLALRNIAAVWVGGVAGLAVVFSPFSPWALVAQRLAQAAFSAAFLFVYTRWRPTLEFSPSLAADYARAAGQLWATQVLSVLGLQFSNMIIGWRLGPDLLGIVRVARKFPEIIHASVTSAVMSMWVPLLSRVAADPAARAALFLRLMQFAALICVPPMIGLSLVAQELTGILLTAQYARAAAALTIIGLSGLFVPLTYFRSAILTAISRNALGMRLAALDVAIISAAVFCFSRYGMEAALLSLTGAAVFTTLFSAYFIVRAVGCAPIQFARAIGPAYLAAGAMALAVLALGPAARGWGHAPALAFKAAIGAGAYLGWLALAHRRWLMENVQFVLERR